MKIKRYSLDEVKNNEAFNFCSNSLFGSMQFALVWESIGGKAVFWVAEKDNRIVALMTAVEFRSYPFKRLQSMPDGCYNKVLSKVTDDRLISEAKEKIMEAIFKSNYAKCFINDYFNEFKNSVNFKEEKISTRVIDISSPDWEPADKRMLVQIKKAQLSSLEIREFDKATDFDNFLKLVNKTEHRHGQKAKYPRKFFEALTLLYGRSKNIIWRWAEIEGRPVASHIWLIENETCLYWQAYSDKSFSELRANLLMTYKMAKSFALGGGKYMNLGATPQGADGLEKYKQRWGGELKSYSIYSNKTFLGRLF